MKNKGFTLIELLGVIVILALIVLLAFPNIINSVKRSSDKIDELTYDLIYSAADLYISNHSNIFPKTNGNKYTILLQDLIDEGYLAQPLKVATSEDITMEQCIQISYQNGFSFDMKDISFCTPKCQLVNDQGEIGAIDMGDKVQCKNEDSLVDNKKEYFYVINNDNGKVDMLTEYNLICGGQVSTNTKIVQKQNSFSCVFFSSDSDFNPIFNDFEDVYNKYRKEQSMYIGYIFDRYKKLLMDNGVFAFDIKPISLNELFSLGCTDEFGTCQNAPEWVLETSYWTRTGILDLSHNEYKVFYVYKGTDLAHIGYENPKSYITSDGQKNIFEVEDGVGFRPVISIQEKDISLN